MGYVGTYFIEEFEKTKREFEKKYGWTFPDPDSEKYLDDVRKMRENLLALKDLHPGKPSDEAKLAAASGRFPAP